MTALEISPHLVANTYAKQILENSSESEQEFYPSRERPHSSGSKSTPTRDYEETSDETTDKKKRPVKRNGLSSPEVKRLEQLYLKGPASYGSTKRLHTQSKLPLGKVQSYLEAKPSFTKYRSIRLKFPRLKVFVKDINEIWSLDLTHVDQLAKYNHKMKYLLVAVDCLSRYLRVELLKTKYATETAEAFQKMIKLSSLKKCGLTMVKTFLELSNNCATNVEFIVLSAKKVCICIRGTSGH